MSDEKGLVAKTKTIKDLLAQPATMEQFQKALPAHITPGRFLRVAYTTISQNEKLLECDISSIMRALIQSAQVGLEPDGILGNAYLVPYRNNKRNGIMEAQFQVGYKGLISLAKRSGDVIDISANVVYENDEFDFQQGTEPKIVHKPTLKKRGEVIAVYAVARFMNDTTTFEVLTMEDVAKIRKASKAADSGPWESWFEEMCKKSAIKRLAKKLQLSPEKTTFNKAAELDEVIDMGLTETGAYMAAETPQAGAKDIKTARAAAHQAVGGKKPDKPADAVVVVSEAQLDQVYKLATKKGITKAELEAEVQTSYGIELAQFPSNEIGAVLEWLNGFQDIE